MEPALQEISIGENLAIFTVADQIQKLKNDFKNKQTIVKKTENKISKRKKKHEEEIIYVDCEKIKQKEKEEIIKIAEYQKEEDIKNTKTNEIINENINIINNINNNINNINNIEEIKEGQNIINEKNKIEEPKEEEENNIQKDIYGNNEDEEYVDILGNAANYDDEIEGIELNRKNIREKIDLKNDSFNQLLSSKVISKEKYLENDSFCEALFLISFSKNCEFIDYYDNVKADCKHNICSGLPAIKPEVIYRHQLKKNYEFVLDNFASEVFFPGGIRLCYEKESNINPIKNYFTFFTLASAEKLYAAAYYFFIKKNNFDFEGHEKNTPIQHEISELKEVLKSPISQDEKDLILKKLDLLEKLVAKKYVYIPYCACLVSKYPFIKQMEKCLESIVKALCDENRNIKDFNEYISNIVDSIPYPPNNTSIVLSLANNLGPIEIRTHFLKDLNLSFEPSFLLTCMTNRNILLLFKLLLLEKYILIIGEDATKISKVILTFLALLYPFKWLNPCFPAMGENYFKNLQLPMAYLAGIRIDIFQENLNDYKLDKDVFVFNLDKNEFEISNNYYLSFKKKVDVSAYIEKNVPKLPEQLENDFLKELEKIIKKSKEKDTDLKMRNLFLQFIIEIIFGYEKCTNKIDDYNVFDKYTFMKNKGENYRAFCNELFKTQLFGTFINDYQSNNKKEYYFKNRLSEFEKIKETKKPFEEYIKDLFETFKNDYTKFTEIKKKYEIEPFFNKNIKIKKKDLKDKRFFTNIRELHKFDNNPKELKVYIIPGQKKEIVIDNKISKSSKIGIINNEEDSLRKRISIFLHEGYKLSEANNKDLEKDLKRIMKKIYENKEKICPDENSFIVSSLLTKQGRNIFLKILINNHSDKTKEFSNASFDSFYSIFCNIIAIISDSEKKEKNEENLIYLMKILKISEKISTTEKNSKNENILITLDDKMHNNPWIPTLINNERFWEIWVDDELKGEDLSIKKLIETKNIDAETLNNYETKIEGIIKSLTIAMLKMRMEKISIESYIQHLCKKYMTNEDNQKNMENYVSAMLGCYHHIYSSKK